VGKGGILHDDHVRARSGRETAPVGEPGEGGGVDRAARKESATHSRSAKGGDDSVEVMVLGQGRGVAVVGAQCGSLGTVLDEEGEGLTRSRAAEPSRMRVHIP
jgi:hypothetical protein